VRIEEFLPDSNSKSTPSELTAPDEIPPPPLIEKIPQDVGVLTSNDPPPSDEIPEPPPIETITPGVGVHAFHERLEAGPDGKTEKALPYIAFEHVSKSFGSLNVLDDVSFFVLPGETLCILGRSGVGKSVSLQQIMGFLKPDSGQILVAGDNIAGYTEEQMQVVRKKVTMVFQNGALFDSLTVGENVAFPLRERGELIEDQIVQIVNGLLEMVGVAGMAELLPSDLSTGMKRSVAIARALSSQPEAILYDEPTTMVDPLMGRLLGDLIHDMRFAQKLADRVLFLHEAKAHFFGTMSEMEKSEDPIIRQFLELDALVLPA
jgi:phospholipid/cholesterol/gamma-HCH transport system ATP-binding protein